MTDKPTKEVPMRNISIASTIAILAKKNWNLVNLTLLCLIIISHKNYHGKRNYSK
jgi:hypothetical protein